MVTGPKTLRRMPEPHFVLGSPAQGLSHSDSGTGTVGAESPQKHSRPYSMPKYWYPAQCVLHLAMVMSVVERRRSGRARGVPSAKQPRYGAPTMTGGAYGT